MTVQSAMHGCAARSLTRHRRARRRPLQAVNPRLGTRPAAGRAATTPYRAVLSVSARSQAQPSRITPQPRQFLAQQQQQRHRRRQQQQRGRVACEAEPAKSCPITGAAAAGKPFGDEDRLSKYGWGSLRLGLLLALAFAAAPQLSAAPEAAAASTAGYLHSWSLAGHAAIGAAGALVSGTEGNLLMPTRKPAVFVCCC